MLAFKITTVGVSAGLILTKEAMAHLKVKKGVASGSIDETALAVWFRRAGDHP